MYHDLYKEQPLSWLPRSATEFHISEQSFKSHLSLIKDSGMPVLSISDFLSGKETRDSMVLTFDDGWLGSFELAVPLLQSFGFKATFFVTSGFVGRKGFCQPEHLIKAVRAGMEIGVHGATHCMLSSCSENKISSELSSCKSFIESVIHQEVVHASLPGGDSTDQVVLIARKLGFKSMSTSTPGINHAQTGPYQLMRIGIRDTTSESDMQRYCHFNVHNESFRSRLLHPFKVLLGMKNYSKLRRKLLDRNEGGKDYFFEL